MIYLTSYVVVVFYMESRACIAYGCGVKGKREMDWFRRLTSFIHSVYQRLAAVEREWVELVCMLHGKSCFTFFERNGLSGITWVSPPHRECKHAKNKPWLSVNYYQLPRCYNDIKSEVVKVFLSVSAVCTFASWQDKATQLPKLGLDDFKKISQLEP